MDLSSFLSPYDNYGSQLSKSMGYGVGLGSPLNGFYSDQNYANTLGNLDQTSHLMQALLATGVGAMGDAGMFKPRMPMGGTTGYAPSLTSWDSNLNREVLNDPFGAGASSAHGASMSTNPLMGFGGFSQGAQSSMPAFNGFPHASEDSARAQRAGQMSNASDTHPWLRILQNMLRAHQQSQQTSQQNYQQPNPPFMLGGGRPSAMYGFNPQDYSSGMGAGTGYGNY